MNLLAFLLAIFASPAQTWERLPVVPTESDRFLSPSVITDHDGLPWVAYLQARDLEFGKYDVNIYVKRYDGTQWQSVGKRLGIRYRAKGSYPTLVIAKDGEIYVSWSEQARIIHGRHNVHVKRWDGQAWQSLGDAVDINIERSASAPVVTTDQQSRPVIAFREFNEELSVSEVNVRRWEDDRWVSLGKPLNADSGENGKAEGIAINNRNQPVVLFRQGDDSLLVKRWNGRDWVALADAINSQRATFHTSIALNKSGSPYVSWTTSAEDLAFTVHVSRWDYPTRSWQQLKPVGKPDVNHPGYTNRLYIDAKNRIRITWQDRDTEDHCVSQWEPLSETWIQVGPHPFASSNRVFSDLSGDDEGNLFLVVANELTELVVWSYRWSPRLFRKRYEAWLGS